jgi:hypothetical protein
LEFLNFPLIICKFPNLCGAPLASAFGKRLWQAPLASAFGKNEAGNSKLTKRFQWTKVDFLLKTSFYFVLLFYQTVAFWWFHTFQCYHQPYWAHSTWHGNCCWFLDVYVLCGFQL